MIPERSVHKGESGRHWLMLTSKRKIAVNQTIDAFELKPRNPQEADRLFNMVLESVLSEHPSNWRDHD